MAVDLCSSPSQPIGSPRLSFSRDLEPINSATTRLDTSLRLSQSPLPTSDFDFSIISTQTHVYSTADQLFSNGKLLPLNHHLHPSAKLKEVLTCPDLNETPPAKPSFWRFGRSTSLNCSNTGTTNKPNAGLTWFLRRSKSAGSDTTTVPKQHRRSTSSSTNNPKCLRKSNSVPKSSPFSSAVQSSYYYGASSKAGSGVRISPVLNVPPPCFAKGGGSGFLGFGYLCGGKKKDHDGGQ